MIRKPFYILKESLYLVRKHKLHFFLPLLIVLALLSILVYELLPSFVVAFIYAGI